jgi:hypothetical protein
VAIIIIIIIIIIIKMKNKNPFISFKFLATAEKPITGKQ